MTTVTTNDFQAKLARLGLLKSELDLIEATSKPLKDEIEQLKLEVMADMQKTASKRTEAYNGYYVIRAERKTISIVNPQEVEAWLLNNDFALDEYMVLDEKRVKAAAESALKQDGELIPGVMQTTSEYISIKEAK